jgi:hypothetical protein
MNASRPLLLAALLLANLSMPHPARAAESYDNCTGFIDSLPATIATQGVWCLRKDLSTAMASGMAIEIDANNVTIDCNHFKIGGLAAGSATSATGIGTSDNQNNAVVRHCNIRGFRTGVVFFGGGGHLVEDSRFDNNTSTAILVSAPGSTIRNNLVIDTGGATGNLQPEIVHAITAQNGVDIINNTVNGVYSNSTAVNASVIGIRANSNGDGSVSGNRVRGLVIPGEGSVYGIYNLYSGTTIVRGNDVQGPDVPVGSGGGIVCTDNKSTARDNVVAGFATGISTCVSSLNTVNPN